MNEISLGVTKLSTCIIGVTKSRDHFIGGHTISDAVILNFFSPPAVINDNPLISDWNWFFVTEKEIAHLPNYLQNCSSGLPYFDMLILWPDLYPFLSSTIHQSSSQLLFRFATFWYANTVTWLTPIFIKYNISVSNATLENDTIISLELNYIDFRITLNLHIAK